MYNMSLNVHLCGVIQVFELYSFQVYNVAISCVIS